MLVPLTYLFPASAQNAELTLLLSVEVLDVRLTFVMLYSTLQITRCVGSAMRRVGPHPIPIEGGSAIRGGLHD